MKIRIERDVMAEAVAWVARSLPNRPSVPILAGLMIQADAEGVTLSSFDYETSARVQVAAKVFDEGEVLVSGKLLAEIARNLPDKPVDLVSSDSKVDLVCGAARFSLQMLPVDDYPALPEIPAATGTIDSTAFAESVAQVVAAAGRDELLPVFTGVRLEINDDVLSLLATDRYRMALRELKWAPAKAKSTGAAIVPGRVLNEAARSMVSGDTITLSLSAASAGDGLIGFEGEGPGGARRLTTRLLDGEFPQFRHLMEIKPNVSVRVKTEDIVASVRRVALVAERNTPIRMLIHEDHIELDAATGDQARASESIEAIVTNHVGGELALSAAGFNPHYLSDAVGALNSPYVYFAFTATGQPCLLQGVDDIDGEPNGDYRHVIMLMRLPN